MSLCFRRWSAFDLRSATNEALWEGRTVHSQDVAYLVTLGNVEDFDRVAVRFAHKVTILRGAYSGIIKSFCKAGHMWIRPSGQSNILAVVPFLKLQKHNVGIFCYSSVEWRIQSWEYRCSVQLILKPATCAWSSLNRTLCEGHLKLCPCVCSCDPGDS